MITKSAEKSHGGRRRLKLTVSKDLGSEMVSFLPKMITECWYFEGFFPTDKLFDSKRMICACVVRRAEHCRKLFGKIWRSRKELLDDFPSLDDVLDKFSALKQPRNNSSAKRIQQRNS